MNEELHQFQPNKVVCQPLSQITRQEGCPPLDWKLFHSIINNSLEWLHHFHNLPERAQRQSSFFHIRINLTSISGTSVTFSNNSTRGTSTLFPNNYDIKLNYHLDRQLLNPTSVQRPGTNGRNIHSLTSLFVSYYIIIIWCMKTKLQGATSVFRRKKWTGKWMNSVANRTLIGTLILHT